MSQVIFLAAIHIIFVVGKYSTRFELLFFQDIRTLLFTNIPIFLGDIFFCCPNVKFQKSTSYCRTEFFEQKHAQITIQDESDERPLGE